MADLFGTDTNITGQSAGGVNPQISGRPPSTGENISKAISGVVKSLSGSDDGVAALGDKLKQAYDKLDSDLKTGAITSVEYNRKRREAYQIARVRAGSVTGAKSMVDDITEHSQVEYVVTDGGIQERNKATKEVIGFRPNATTPEAVMQEEVYRSAATYEANFPSSSVTGGNLASKVAEGDGTGFGDKEGYVAMYNISTVRNRFASGLSRASHGLAINSAMLSPEESAKYKANQVRGLKETLAEGFYGLGDRRVLRAVQEGRITPGEVLLDLDAYYADTTALIKESKAHENGLVDLKDIQEEYKTARENLSKALSSAQGVSLEAAEFELKAAKLANDMRAEGAKGRLTEDEIYENNQIALAATNLAALVQIEQSVAGRMTPEARKAATNLKERILRASDVDRMRTKTDQGAINLLSSEQKWAALNEALDSAIANAAKGDETDALVAGADAAKSELKRSGVMYPEIDNAKQVESAGAVFQAVIHNPLASVAYEDEITVLFNGTILPAIGKLKKTSTERDREVLEANEKKWIAEFNKWQKEIKGIKAALRDPKYATTFRNKDIYPEK